MLGCLESINAEMQQVNCNWERKWQVFPTLMSYNEIDVFCILEANGNSAMSPSSQEADLQAFPSKLKMAACPTQVVVQRTTFAGQRWQGAAGASTWTERVAGPRCGELKCRGWLSSVGSRTGESVQFHLLFIFLPHCWVACKRLICSNNWELFMWMEMCYVCTALNTEVNQK